MDRGHLRMLSGLIIAVIILPAHFINLRSLGVYEDDYWAIVPFINTGFSEMVDYSAYHFSTWMTGRPLNYILPAAMSALGSRIAGLDGIYLLSASVLILNCNILRSILSHYSPAPVSVAAAVFYGLFPADTTRILLVHGAHVQGSMTFMLAGFWCLLRPSPIKWLAYPVSSLSLLSYESAFLPFLIAPLLWLSLNKRWMRQFLLHTLLCGLVIAIVGTIRLSKGDSRAGSVVAEPMVVLYRSFSSLFIGPATSIRQLIEAPLGVPGALDTIAAVASLMTLAIFVLYFRSSRYCSIVYRERRVPTEGPLNSVQSPPAPIILFAAGMAFWSVSYALAIVDPHYPPTRTIGRLTSVHVAAGFGAAISFASLFQIALGIGSHRLQRVTQVSFAIYLSTLVSYNLEIQQSYTLAWNEARRFWGQVLDLTPDLASGTVVLVTGEQAPQAAAISSNSWSDPLVLQHFHDRPQGEQKPLLVMLNNSGSLIGLRVEGDEVFWKPMYWSGVEAKLDLQNLIILQSDKGTLSRIDQLNVASIGRTFHSKPFNDQSAAAWPISNFYRYMFERYPHYP